jgi:hypothetical protein
MVILNISNSKEPSVLGFFGGKKIQNQTSHKNSPKPQKLGINSKPQKTDNLHERTIFFQ